MLDEQKIISFLIPLAPLDTLRKNELRLAKYIGCSPADLEQLPYMEVESFLAIASHDVQEQQ